MLPNHFDELWVLGDLVNYGPQPAEVIEFVRKWATLLVRGNHDDAVAFDRDPQCSPAFRSAAEETRRYTSSVLNEKHKNYLADLPHYRWVRRGRWTLSCCALGSPARLLRRGHSKMEEGTLRGGNGFSVCRPHAPAIFSPPGRAVGRKSRKYRAAEDGHGPRGIRDLGK